jgi:hypothetical protein
MQPSGPATGVRLHAVPKAWAVFLKQVEDAIAQFIFQLQQVLDLSIAPAMRVEGYFSRFHLIGPSFLMRTKRALSDTHDLL